ncbi:ankyrin [Apiospora phragmitis]|uniref:Ankyrin n=1 Tax=Apiospora phragmitis TaxID=2905665 RepID=A0ABR1VUL7_9PEZI
MAIHTPGSSCLDKGKERYVCPLYAALAMGSHEAAKVLLSPIVQSFPASHEVRRRFDELLSRKEPWPAFPRDSKFHKEGELHRQMLKSSEELALLFLSAGLLRETNALSLFECAAHERRELFAIGFWKSANTDQIESWPCTPLHIAAREGLLDVTSFLLETLNDVDARDKKGRAPLSYAATSNSKGVAKLLLDTSKADVNARDEKVDTGIVDVDARDVEGRSPLSHAITGDSMYTEGNINAVIKLLLASGKADINSCNKEGRTPLIWASYTFVKRSELKSIMETLLGSGAEFNSRDKEGCTSLIYAAKSNDAWAVDILLKSGADVDSQDKHGRTPLSWAAGSSHKYNFGMDVIATIRVLGKGKAEINARDDLGRTPLSWAATAEISSEADTSLWLLEHGADPAITDLHGRTAYDHFNLFAQDHTDQTKLDHLQTEDIRAMLWPS